MIGLIPAQREEDLFFLGDNSQRRSPDELPIRSKENGDLEPIRPGYSLENQEGLHFNVITCGAVFQRELLCHSSYFVGLNLNPV